MWFEHGAFLPFDFRRKAREMHTRGYEGSEKGGLLVTAIFQDYLSCSILL